MLTGKERGFMSDNKFYDDILGYITEHGETGVNVLAKEFNVPLSSMQRYLERQTYFRKTVNRKWDLPNNVDTDIKTNTMTLMVSSVETALLLLSSQLSEIQSSVQNALMPVSTLKRAVNTVLTPVADKTSNIDNEVLLFDKSIKDTYAVFKQHVKVCPEEYQEIISNVDLYKLTIEMGTKFIAGDFNAEISSLFLEKSSILSDDIIDILKEYQKEA